MFYTGLTYERFTGQSATDSVQLLSEEDSPMQFSFVDESCYTQGHSSHITVEPMSGVLPPKSRFDF